MQESTPQKSLTYRPSVPLGKIFHGTEEEVWPKQGQVVQQVEVVGIVASPVVHTNPGHLDKQCRGATPDFGACLYSRPG